MTQPAQRPFQILAIDGGGFRGAYAAHVLARMEEAHGVDWHRDFDLITGTSTGSIIASAIACRIPIARVLNLYQQHGRSIFKKRWFSRIGLFSSRYRSDALQQVLMDEFGNQTLGEVKKPLILPATDIGNGCVHVFKSAYDPGFTRDQHVKVRDAILASCSAPTYFDPKRVEGKDVYLLADGGLWANNPALVAAVDAKRRLGQPFENLRILSIGTGDAHQFYPMSPSWWQRCLGWGFATRWGRGRFIEMLLNLQSQKDNNILGLILNKEQIVRINFSSDRALPLDDPSMWDTWISKAGHDFTHNSDQLRQFIRKAGDPS